MNMYKSILTACLFFSTVNLVAQENYVSDVWVSDLGNGKYKNPIIFADYSDPDACRVGNDYYLTSSSFGSLPGLQILHSKDMVNWSIIGTALPYAINPNEYSEYTAHGEHVYAPSIRYHNGEFYVFWGDPDKGAFMVKARDPQGPWTEPLLVKSGKGIIDTCPLWDDDGKVYMVHAYAGSRAQLNSVIAICELNNEATKAITQSRIIFDGHGAHNICEGPKFYKKDGYYYIFCPAGGVSNGWQIVLRSKDIYGPYECKTVLSQGKTKINGPHQGALLDTSSGEDWFIHFQDVGTYGRLLHLQPVKWKNGWPVIGIDKDGDGCGEPVLTYRKPDVGKNYPICAPQESDEFNENKLGLQWQWHGDINEKWYYCNSKEGKLRLYSYPVVEGYKNLWDVTNLLLQKTPAPYFNAEMKLEFNPSKKYFGERTGLVVMGMDYAGLFIENTEQGLILSQAECKDAASGKSERSNQYIKLESNKVYLKVKFYLTGERNQKSYKGYDQIVKCDFSYSINGKDFLDFGNTFQAKKGKWIGVKVGTFITRPRVNTNDSGWVDIDWFRIKKE